MFLLENYYYYIQNNYQFNFKHRIKLVLVKLANVKICQQQSFSLIFKTSKLLCCTKNVTIKSLILATEGANCQ